jgi:hypothetical protein
LRVPSPDLAMQHAPFETALRETAPRETICIR